MRIFIDESGTFTYTTNPVGWSTICAIAIPETGLTHACSVLEKFKSENGKNYIEELKLGKVSDEISYYRLLNRLVSSGCTIYSIATNANLNTPSAVSAHKKNVEIGILSNLEKMRHEGGRQYLLKLAETLRYISPQLHIQLTCQIRLLYQVVSDTILYYAQREPSSLSQFSWRIDAKEKGKQVKYELAFKKLSPAYLQTMSLSQPMPMIAELDYSHMSKYMYALGDGPTYLRDDYGIDVNLEKSFNIGKIILDDISFTDSKTCFGIQLADLLSAGIRRCLRGGFKDNLKAAMFLGRLMVQRSDDQCPLMLVSLGTESKLDEPTAKLVRMMHSQQKPMLTKAKL